MASQVKGHPGRPKKSRGDQRRSWELISIGYIGQGHPVSFHRGQEAILGRLERRLW